MSVLINASTSTGLVQSADTSGEIELQSNGTTALKVNTNEGIQILNCLGVGNATPSTSGAGITFPATQSASTDANTLDDYEEGTYTATITQGMTSPTYNNQAGRYVKIGRICYFQLVINVTGGTRNANGISVSLPFTSNNTGTFAGGGFFSYVTGSIVGSTTTNLPTIYVGGNNTELNFYNTNGGSFTGNDLNTAIPQFYITGWMECA
jgi:hypothetical protein